MISSSGCRFEGKNGRIFVFALVNAGLFALYIVLAHRAASREQRSGLTDLGGAMIVAAVLTALVGAAAALGRGGDPLVLAAGVGVGLCSSVIPYVTDQLAMVELSRATYSLMVALLPAVAVIVGVVVLAQLPSAIELTAVALVIAGVAVHRAAPEAI